MAYSNINSVFVTGNLTRDVEIKQTNSGTSVAELGIAVNTSVKKDGAWESKPNYFQVVCWGKQAELCNEYLSKGSKVIIAGRLEWQKWENKEGQTNSRVIIVAEQVEFGSPKQGQKNETPPDSEPSPDDLF